MRDPNRIPVILEALKVFWESRPDERLGQILSNVNRITSINNHDIFYMEDDNIVKGLDVMKK
ncbi:MAG: hypothetical protein PHT94_00550 [Candidatus Nanoarchaeia archaeon]|nr:hypothetical protein [Candidatus Nanoarchaeia archaeon]